ncbi:hypothetical protein Bhyg_15646 [Pseudolycoriella hygida]|uniref:Uncharacterized protein n=1 Tax=Pseudolycoriella hygida TaxID=35572 RepID=A0A9Q0MKC7_9DIPT|nr:hypothetical protein Bhyg_15646 [Pseudolycoriella hygida]
MNTIRLTKFFQIFNKQKEQKGCLNAFSNGPNLRVAVILISIYHMIISQILLFAMLLSLTHAEKMNNILIREINDQKEREEFYETILNSNGESMNQVRFRDASELATYTTACLYAGVAIAALYVFVCFGLLCGTLKYRHEAIAPWLICQILYEIGVVTAAYDGVSLSRNIYASSVKLYWFLIALNVGVDLCNWLVVRCFYKILKEMNGLTKTATLWIPCPRPGEVPIHYRKENMYVGDGGHKHTLLAANEFTNPNYVV